MDFFVNVSCKISAHNFFWKLMISNVNVRQNLGELINNFGDFIR